MNSPGVTNDLLDVLQSASDDPPTLLLEVSRADIERHFLLTNRDLLPSPAPVFESFEALGGDPSLLRIAPGNGPPGLDH